MPRGVVFGLVGENGAGKTTLIKHLLGLLKAQIGHGAGVRPRPGARSGRGAVAARLPERGPRLARLDAAATSCCATCRPSTRPGTTASPKSLRRQFDLDPAPGSRRFRKASGHGRAAGGAGLPARALVLDEPSTGLDPIVRREILAAIIRTIAEEGRTVLFSSHLLDEVERVSDHVALIDRGQIVLRGSLESIKASHRRLTLRFDEPLRSPAGPPGLVALGRLRPRVDDRLPRLDR